MNQDHEIQISWNEIDTFSRENVQLIDIMDAASHQRANVPGTINIPQDELEDRLAELDKDKKIILFCRRGLQSLEAAKELSEQGYDVYSVAGGYNAWLLYEMEKQEQKEQNDRKSHKDIDNPENPDSNEDAGKERQKRIEESLRKKFHKSIFSRFTKAINEYQLVQEGDRIAVCISGGKDSMLMAKLFQELQRHKKCHFELVFMVMDPGYNEYNRKVIEENARILGIPVTIFESSIFDAVFEIEKSPCYLCARMRRGHLYKKAKELGCNKIALGHHYDDVIETILMGMLYGAQVQTMMPKLHSTNFEGMELIRPLYLVREDDIKHWRDYNNLKFIQCACRFTDTCSVSPDGNGDSGSKRQEVKMLIREMKKKNPYVESNIFRSIENVNLDTVIGYKEHGNRHSFLDEYDQQS